VEHTIAGKELAGAEVSAYQTKIEASWYITPS
jgi:hypothetical protein